MALNANQRSYLKHLAAAGDLMALEALAIEGTGRAGLVSLGAAAAKSATGVHAGIAGTTSIDPVTTGLTNPAQPRNVSATFAALWDGGNVIVKGTNQWGLEISETIVAVAGSTVYGTKIFKTVTSIEHTVVGVAADAYSVGTGDKLGVSVDVVDTLGMGMADGVAEVATVDALNDAVTFTTVPNGAKVLVALLNF